MRKNGFTLVELLGVLVIIGILSAISVAIYTNSINSSKNSLSDFQKKQLEEAARTYVAINTISFNNLFDDPSICVSIDNAVLNREITDELLVKSDKYNVKLPHGRNVKQRIEEMTAIEKYLDKMVKIMFQYEILCFYGLFDLFNVLIVFHTSYLLTFFKCKMINAKCKIVVAGKLAPEQQVLPRKTKDIQH